MELKKIETHKWEVYYPGDLYTKATLEIGGRGMILTFCGSQIDFSVDMPVGNFGAINDMLAAAINEYYKVLSDEEA